MQKSYAKAVYFCDKFCATRCGLSEIVSEFLESFDLLSERPL
jgi:hypothetical protein